MTMLKLDSAYAKNVIVGGVQAKAVYLSGDRVWPKMQPWTDLFERSGPSNLGSDWLCPVPSGRSCVISAGAALQPDIGDAGRWGAYSGVSNTYSIPQWEDYRVKAQLVTPAHLASDNWTSLILGWDGIVGTGTKQVIALMMSTGSGCKLVTNTFINASNGSGDVFDTNETVLSNKPTVDVPSSGLIVFEKRGMAYNAYLNGSSTPFMTTTWNGLSQSDQASRRRPVICVEGNKPFGQVTYHSPAIGSITVEDL